MPQPDTAVQLTLTEPPNEYEPDEPYNVDQAAVLAVLRDGQVHTRRELAARALMTDRQLRDAISALRLSYWPICSSSGMAGYRLSFAPADLERLEAEMRSRALAALRVRARLRRIRERRTA